MRWLTASTDPLQAIEDGEAVQGAYGAIPTLHFVEGEALLLDATADRLYRLDRGATLVWSLIVEGCTNDDIRTLLTTEYGMTRQTAADLLAQVLAQWRSGRMKRASALAKKEPLAALSLVHARPAATEHYALHGSVYSVGYASCALRDAAHPLLEPLAVGAQHAQAVAVKSDGHGVAFLAGDRLIGGAPAVSSAGVALRAALTQLAVEQSGGLCAVHAGALSAASGAILLPGNAGRGKSTLSAGLAAHGFEMLSDDTTLLVGEPLQVAALPTGLCVKRGAYPILSPLFPRLSALSEWERPDGLFAKYLMPGLDLRW